MSVYDAGDVLDGWELIERIGRGGMGEVWRARHVESSVDAAVKILFARPDRREEVAGRFAREVEAANHLDHPGVCEVWEYGTDASTGAMYLVMELLRGVSFRRWLVDTRGTPLEAIELLREVLDPLSVAHRVVDDGEHAPIVHRDLKPENLFVLEPGDVGQRIKLLDFGIASRAGTEQITETGVGMGTAGYMSPEQATDARVVGPSADVWSIGVMLYEIVAGRAPFSSPSRNETISKILTRDPVPVQERAPGVPPALAGLIRACLRKEPERRPADAGALAEALDAILADPAQRDALDQLDALEEGPLAQSPSPTTRGAPEEATPWGGYAVGALLVLGVAGATLYATLRDPSDPSDPSDPEPVEPVAVEREPLADAGAPSPNRWVRVEPGPMLQLGVTDDALDAGVSGFRPSAEVHGPAEPFLVMQHEVTFGELESWLGEELEMTGQRRPAWLPADAAERAPYPATGVDWTMARRYCVERGGDLPTEAQWETAARGSSGRPYSWGSGPPDPQRVNLGRDAHPAPVMSFDQDRTPGPAGDAIWDLTGNAREWTRELWRNSDGSAADWSVSEGRTFRAVRGLPLSTPSRWVPPSAAPLAHRVPLCATGPCPDGTDDVREDVGFRCVRAVPTPPGRSGAP